MKIMICSDKSIVSNPDVEPEFRFFNEETIKYIESKFDEIIWNDTGRKFTKEELKEKIKDCDAVITCWQSNTFDEEILECADKLKMIAHLAGSVAWLVTPAVYDKGIVVCGANDSDFAESVAEGALASILVKLRKYDEIARVLRDEKSNGWKKIKNQRGLFDKTVGIVSFGAVAEYLVKLLQPFHCKIKVFSRSVSDAKLNEYNMQRAGLEEIFSTCDVISVHTAWNKQTEKMISRELISSMKDGALLVNTARGAVIDEEALTEELATGRISAALDVFVEEPLSSDSELYNLDNVFITDHRGGPTSDRYPYIAKNIVDDVYNYLVFNKVPNSMITKERAISMTLA